MGCPFLRHKKIMKMNISKTKTDQLLITAFGNSEWDSVDFALITIGTTFLKQVDEAFHYLQPMKESHSFAAVSFYAGECSFHPFSECVDIAEIIENMKDSERPYCYVNPCDPELLPQTEQQIIGLQTIVDSNGWVYLKAFGKHTAEEYWTSPFYYPDLLEPGKSTMIQQVDVVVRMTFEVNAAIESDMVKHQLSHWVDETMQLMDDAGNDYAFISSTLLSIKEEADIYKTDKKEKGN
jgi:hypothetical protein